MPRNVDHPLGEEAWRRLSPGARSVWGKSDRHDPSGWDLPLHRHMTDSGAVAGLLWDRWVPPVVRRIIAGERDEVDARQLAVWLATAHDLGKATPAFAGQMPRLAGRMHRAGLEFPRLREARLLPHEVASHILLRQWLTTTTGMARAVADTFAVVVGGHHGIPPTSDALTTAEARPELLGDTPAWHAVHTELAAFAADVSAVRLALRVDCPLGVRAQPLLTGIVILADWIASDPELFPFGDPTPSLHRARRAWDDLRLPPPWSPTLPSLGDTSTYLRSRFALGSPASARPVQEAVVDLARSVDEPGLMIVEAQMGEGKTEAALLAAEVLAARTGAGGCFVALPTMATSDAMFTRVREWAEHLPGVGSLSTFLAHGKAGLNPEYDDVRRASRARAVAEDTPDAHGEVVAVQWLSGRKKGVLSSVVVGTIDQVLVGALKSRHLVLRHLALAGKVVVVDEAHAADVYMSEYLDRVLQWLGAYGVPTVVLSATLPSQQRIRMVEAYREGQERARRVVPDVDAPVVRRVRRRSAGAQPAPAPADPYPQLRRDIGYPVVTATTSTGVAVHECRRSGREAVVCLQRAADDDTSLLDLLDGALADGGCVGIVRNTVDRAQRTAALLRERYGADVLLLHSRFLAVDRAERERQLRVELGRDGRERPARRLVVGTQVLEQSLDIDLDLLVTDLAPMDLLLQRIGRLHRHERPRRPEPMQVARCVITGVQDWSGAPPQAVDGSTHVYGHALLFRAMAVLAELGTDPEIRLPDDVARLVQRAYADDLIVPSSWQTEYAEAEHARGIEDDERRTAADTYRLGGIPRPGSSLVDWLAAHVGESEDTVAGQKAVRDGEDTLEVVVAQRVDGEVRVLPWVTRHGGRAVPTEHEPPWDVARTLATCTVRLPARMSKPWTIDRVIGAIEDMGGFTGWQQTAWLQGQLALVLDQDLTARVADYDVRYSQVDGLTVTPAGETER